MNEKIKELRELFSPQFILVLLLVAFGVGFLGWYIYGGSSVPDNGRGAHDTREQLDRIGTEQSIIKDNLERVREGISDGIGTLDEIAGGLERTQDAIRESEERRRELDIIITDSERRLAESKGIIDSIRKRGGEN